MSLPDDFAARVRAARAYANGPQGDFGVQIDRSGSTIKNWESGNTKPEEAASGEIIRRLARASGLPEWFFTVKSLASMRMAVGADPVAQRLERIEALLERALDEPAKSRTPAGRAIPPAALVHKPEDPEPTQQNQRQAQNREAQDNGGENPE